MFAVNTLATSGSLNSLANEVYLVEPVVPVVSCLIEDGQCGIGEGPVHEFPGIADVLAFDYHA